MHEYLDPSKYAPKWKWWLPPNYSSFGEDVDLLYWWIFYITMITFVVVEGAKAQVVEAQGHREGEDDECREVGPGEAFHRLLTRR